MNAHTNPLLWIHNHPAKAGPWIATLNRAGFEVISSPSDTRAVAILKNREIDLILLDNDSTDSTGERVLREIKHLNGIRPIPVIMVSDAGAKDRVEAYLRLGADDILFEPEDLPWLQFRITRCLQTQRLKSELTAHRKALKTAQQLADDFTKVILPIGIELSEEKNLDILLRDILIQAKKVCNADGGTLYLREGNHLRFAIMVTDSLNHYCTSPAECEAAYKPLPIYLPSGASNTQNIATAVSLNGLSINIPDVYKADGFDLSGTKAHDRKNNYRTVSCLTVPLKNYDNDVIGVLQMINALRPESKAVIPFDSYRQQVIEALASQASIVLNNRMLLERQKELLLFEHELHIGHDIQSKFLPDRLPRHKAWEIAAHFQPARQISGDFYDAFELSEGQKWALAIGDVCDKGVGAALFLASVSTLVRSSTESTDDISVRRIVERINEHLYRNYGDAGMFVTLFFGVIDLSTGMLEYVNGGHNPPIIIHAGGKRTALTRTAPFIGAIPGIEVKSGRIRLEKDDTLFAFTDGVTEATDPQQVLFSEQRLFDHFSTPIPSAQTLLDRIQKDLQDHMGGSSQADDITMMTIKREH